MATELTAAPRLSTATPPKSTAAERLYSLDAFRGFTMAWMISEGFLQPIARHPWLGHVAFQFTHRDWHWINAWDMIQPFFMFIVGVAMPFSFEKRWAAGESWTQSLVHVLKRCALLILFGLIARSIQANRPVLDLINVLAQLSFTYLVAFLVLRKSWRVQAGVAFALLALEWAIYQFYGLPDPWARNANAGWYLDQAMLGKNWGGGYATINCLGSAFNTIFGVIAGNLLRRNMKAILLTGVAFTIAGFAMDPLVPVIKKIWTPSFALASTGLCLLALALFYWICDVKQKRGWATVFVIVGSNSIFIYLFHEILGRWMKATAPVFTGWAVNWWGPWGQVFTACVVIAFQIYVCWWLYKRRIFFKL